jgi:hypothetical protein
MTILIGPEVLINAYFVARFCAALDPLSRRIHSSEWSKRRRPTQTLQNRNLVQVVVIVMLERMLGERHTAKKNTPDRLIDRPQTRIHRIKTSFLVRFAS